MPVKKLILIRARTAGHQENSKRMASKILTPSLVTAMLATG